MAKREAKGNWLHARADDELNKQLVEYMNAADMSMADIVRKGAREYMENHPVKQPKEQFNPTGALSK